MSLFSFTRNQRLLTVADFQWVFAQADYKISDRHFLLLARTCQHTDSYLCRLGLVVAKKHAKLAVERNFIKRTLRESFRLFQSEHSIMPALDIVVLTRPDVATAEPQQLRKVIDNHWLRLAKKHQQKNTSSTDNNSPKA